jgi:hypothetical protein
MFLIFPALLAAKLDEKNIPFKARWLANLIGGVGGFILFSGLVVLL